MAVPFSLGMVLDIIYSGTNDLVTAREKLDQLCLMLCGVFLVGGLCNFGRVYLMSISGKIWYNCHTIHRYIKYRFEFKLESIWL